MPTQVERDPLERAEKARKAIDALTRLCAEGKWRLAANEAGYARALLIQCQAFCEDRAPQRANGGSLEIPRNMDQDEAIVLAQKDKGPRERALDPGCVAPASADSGGVDAPV